MIASQFLLKTTFEYLSSSSCLRKMSVQIATKVYKKDLSVKQATEVWLVLGLFYSLMIGRPGTLLLLDITALLPRNFHRGRRGRRSTSELFSGGNGSIIINRGTFNSLRSVTVSTYIHEFHVS